MNEGITVALGAALWLGLLTAIAPCPLATNVAAMSFIGRQVGSVKTVFSAGLAYAFGRVIAYVLLGILVAWGLLAASGLSVFLQTYANRLLGPVLILVGMVLVGLLTTTSSLSLGGEALQERVMAGGPVWAVVLGFVFALSFCPPSAALFFGSLVPLAIGSGHIVAVPVLYGVGTALPVMIFAVALARGAQAVASTFERITVFEWWAKRVTGSIFILAGIYLSLIYVWKVL